MSFPRALMLSPAVDDKAAIELVKVNHFNFVEGVIAEAYEALETTSRGHGSVAVLLPSPFDAVENII